MPLLREYFQLWIRYVEENIDRRKWRKKTA
jgi:hypothetical protein